MASGVAALRGSLRANSARARPSTPSSATVFPSRPSASASADNGPRSPSTSARLPSAIARPSTRPRTPLPATASNASTGAPPCRLPWLPKATPQPEDDRSPARGWRLARSPRPLRSRAAVRTSVKRGLPSVSVPVLSTTSVSTLLERLQRFSRADQDPGARAASGRHHDGHRRGEPERARTGDDEHGDGVHQRVRKARLGTHRAPDDRSERSLRRLPAARRRRTPRRRGVGWAHGFAAPRSPTARSARAPCPPRRAPRASRSCRCR